MSIAHRKKQLPLLNLLINQLLTRPVVRILSLNDECTFSKNCLIILLCNSSANCSLCLISFLKPLPAAGFLSKSF